jgi:hypothetical protein
VAVLATKTEPKCKLCRSDKRGEIDVILELRSDLTRGPDTEDGKKGELLWPLPKVLEQLGAWGIVNPTEENVKNHWKKHCARIRTEAVEAAQTAALAKIEELREGGQHADTDDNLRLVGTIWREQLMARIARGEEVVISTQDMLKAAAELTRRSASETQHELLSEFVGGMAAAAKAIAGGHPAVRQIEGAEVVEAEYSVQPGSEDE